MTETLTHDTDWPVWGRLKTATARGGKTMIPIPTRLGRMMYFDHLSSSSKVNGFLALAWRFTDDSRDRWTVRLNRFKFRLRPGHTRAVRGACMVLPTALSEVQWPDGGIALVTALPSGARVLNAVHPLARLGEAIANHMGWQWLPQLLSKEPHRRISSLTDMYERRAEIEGKYTSAAPPNVNMIVILDDLMTRGDTMGQVAEAISAHNSQITFRGVALGKNESRSFAASHGEDLSNDDVPAEWADCWDQA